MNMMEKYGSGLAEKFNRESNLELLRIIAMLFIIMHHYAIYSEFNFTNNLTLNKIIIDTFAAFGKLGVILFIMISGYFYDKSGFKGKKVINLLAKVWIYAIIGLIIGIIANSNLLSYITILKSIMPTTFGLYWFASCFIIIYLFSPFIKRIVQNVEQTNFRNFLLLMIFIWGIVTLIPETKTFYNDFIYLIMIYLLGIYLKKYQDKIKIISTNKRKIIISILIAIVIGIMIVLEMISTNTSELKNYIQFFNRINSPLILALGIFIFNGFKQIKSFKNTLINIMASTTFGIYLIHDNLFIKDIIWNKIIRATEYTDSILLLPYSIVAVIGVFIVCSIIDYIISNSIVQGITNTINNMFEKIKNKKET